MYTPEKSGIFGMRSGYLAFSLKAIQFLLFTFVVNMADAQTTSYRKMLFDRDWRFHRVNDSLASEALFDDSEWRKIDLPHDWSIEDIPGTDSPFNPDAISGVSGGFTTGGKCWYRKSFTIPETQKDKRLVIQFDGVYMNADVWINGKHAGNHPYGYTSFAFDITDKINRDGKNVIAVQVKNEGRNSRWYSGSGIYRHVWLSALDPAYIGQWGVFITTPSLNTSLATINVKTKVFNKTALSSEIVLITRIQDENGIEKAFLSSEQTLQPDAASEFSQDINIDSPKLWSIETPVLYTAVSEVYRNNTLTDVVTTPFGIRSISFDVENGFQLNGKTVKLKGGCVHHDNGPLGAASYDRAEERKVELLKASGYNAIRTSHNPPSPEFLDACDRLGMLIIDEAFDTWNERKNRNDYHLYFNEWWQTDLESMVYRDRNHPSVIMWSTGNEIPNRGKPEVAAVAKQLAEFIKTLDTTRPVTAGVNGIDQKPDAFLAALDIAGYNYAEASYESDHERLPERVMYGAESFPLDAYQYWMGVEDHPWVIGDFVWTAFDYIGEASIGWLGYPQNKNFYPWNLGYCGDIDICGWKRPQSYYRDALWKKGQLSVFVKAPKPTFAELNEKLEAWSRWNWPDVVADWNWKGYEDSLLEVVIYSSCETVELFLNDKPLGKMSVNRSTKFLATFHVPYTEGRLKAIGYDGDKQVTESWLQTASEVSKIKLTPDRSNATPNGQDLIYVTVELADANGIRHPKAENLLRFSVEGAATIAGVGNANPKSIESFQASERKAWQGKCLVILKTKDMPGKIKLSATVAGLPEATVMVNGDGEW